MLRTEIPKANGALSLSFRFKGYENLIDLFTSLHHNKQKYIRT